MEMSRGNPPWLRQSANGVWLTLTRAATLARNPPITLALGPSGAAHLSIPSGPTVTTAANRVLAQLPGMEFETHPQTSELNLPPGWLA